MSTFHKQRREQWAQTRQASERKFGFYLSFHDLVDAMEQELKEVISKIDEALIEDENEDMRAGLEMSKNIVINMLLK